MENAELDVALEELENRLERLRALYEQYFMGIERIEPQIPRKDIDRRIYVLRREKIRNTAKRFKLQTIISRYNTFQQYWQRICREIENGTYKRHLIRAERIAPGQLLTIAARKRLGRHIFDDVEAPEASGARQSAPPGAAPPSVTPPPSIPPGAPRPASAPPSSVPRPAPAAGPPTPKAVPPAKPPKPGVRPAKPSPEPPAPPAAIARPFESLHLDMDFMGDWDPTREASRERAAASRPFGEALAPPLGASPRAAAPPGVPPTAAAPLKPAARVPVTASKPTALPSPGAPATERVAAAASEPKPKPQTTTAAPMPTASANAEVPPARKLGAAPIARPTSPQPAAKPAAPADLSDERVRELHARLVEAKRQTKDAATVSVEGLARSLKATEAKLREQHKNRKIDFDVVIKDGKAVLKPIVR